MIKSNELFGVNERINDVLKITNNYNYEDLVRAIFCINICIKNRSALSSQMTLNLSLLEYKKCGNLRINNYSEFKDFFSKIENILQITHFDDYIIEDFGEVRFKYRDKYYKVIIGTGHNLVYGQLFCLESLAKIIEKGNELEEIFKYNSNIIEYFEKFNKSDEKREIRFEIPSEILFNKVQEFFNTELKKINLDKIKKEKSIKEKCDRVIDAKGCFVMPGFIDMHVHLRDPGFEQKETIETGARAAVHGGFTTILAMPITKPVVDNPDVVNYVHNKAKTVGAANVLQVGAVTKGQQGKELSDIEGMVKAGIPAISEDGKSVMNAQLYREAMELAAKYNIAVLAHCEDINLVNGGVMNADVNARELGLGGITNSVEDIIIARDIMLSRDTGARLHLCHCSTKDSVSMVKHAKMEGIHVTAEVCPHHFTLTSDDIRKIEPTVDTEKKVAIEADADTNYKMNPPLRTKEDVQALKEGLRDDVMDVIATDHAPHTFEDKNTSMKSAPFGIVGLETAACLTYTELVLGGYLTPMQMAEKMSYNPAKIIGIDKGDIEPGKVADIVIFDPDETYVIDKNTFFSKGRNTPFDGRKVTGKVRMTLVNGQVVYEDKEK